MCRKLETEEEKVLPFYASSLTAEEQADIRAAVMEEYTEPLALVNCYSLSDITAFSSSTPAELEYDYL